MEEKIEVDIIIASYAQTDELKETTINCLNSLFVSEDPEKIKFNVVVLESQKSLSPYQYEGSKTIYPEVPFGYNRYMNIGIAMTSSPYICLCNNDLIFHPNWAIEILKPLQQYVDVFSASPVCSVHHPKIGFKLNDGFKLGFRIRYEVSGWCIFLKRELLRRTGILDENFIFWGADNDYANTLYMLKINHLLVTSSIVDHFENKTLNVQPEERQEELTEKAGLYFGKKWKPKFGDEWELIE